MATLRRSEYIHLLPLADKRVLVVHAITHMRWAVDPELAALITYFDKPRLMSRALTTLQRTFGFDKNTLRRCIAGLLERRVLSDRTRESEVGEIVDVLGAGHGRDPAEILEAYQRKHKEGVEPYWSVTTTDSMQDVAGEGARIDVVMFGDCELQMESDFLHRAGRAQGLDIRIAATFPGDVRFASERAHQMVIIGAMRSRDSIVAADTHGDTCCDVYLAEVKQILTQLRTHTQAPILIDNLPEPTVQPLGLAEPGIDGHRNRFRRANLAVAKLVEQFTDVTVVDIAAALNAAGSRALLDDGLVSFTHFGSAGWLLQRPPGEITSVHGIFPDLGALAQSVGGNPYGREEVTALAHLDALRTVLAIDAKKCVVVDLDGVLWPGVLAETGKPFAWTPEISGEYSYIGLYFGIHEALRALQRRGVLLACVSKNDLDTVRALWTYPNYYPHERLLTLDSFVTHRINWTDKATNIESISKELGLALSSFAFIDDHPVERERVHQTLPEVALFGEDLFALRRQLLTDPRLQPAHLTKESSRRTALVKAQLQHAKARAEAPSETDFIASLQVVCDIAEMSTVHPAQETVERVAELFQRTTQFNTTARKFSVAELTQGVAEGRLRVYTLQVRDRFADHGLVGAAVLENNVFIAFAMSCRVMGLGGVENSFVQHIVRASRGTLRGHIYPTERNAPVRHIFKDNGFVQDPDGCWVRAAEQITGD